LAQPVMLPSFAAGELSPSLFARVDLAKWHSGAALLENFFVDYRGGVTNRAGTKYLGDSLDASKPSRLIGFVFSSTQSYVLVFDNLKMRVIKDGAFVVDDSGNHYTIDTPYVGSDLALLKFAQSADVMTLVHPTYAPRNLTRVDHDDWQLSLISFVPTSSRPANVVATPSIPTGTTTYRYVVTAVAANGVTESLPSDPADAANSETMSTTAGAHQMIAWDAVQGAQLYNVYRQPEVDQGIPSDGQFFGFIGTSSDTGFVDANISPDFTRTPPQDNDPFNGAHFGGGIASITFSPGNDYFNPPVVSFFYGAGTGGTGADGHAYLGAQNVEPFGASSGYVVGDLLTAQGGIFLTRARFRVREVANLGSGPGGIVSLDIIDGGRYADGHNTSVIPLPGTLFIDWVNQTAGTDSIATTGGTGTGALLKCRWGVSYIKIDAPGSGYSADFSIPMQSGRIFAAGYGTAVAHTSAIYGNWPGAVAYFQQRQTYAGSIQFPETFYMSKTGDYLNFGYSTPSRPDDSIQGTLAAQQVNAIKHLIPMQSLIALTSAGAWRIDSGQQGGAVTPATIEANPQVFHGCSDVPPLVIGRELLYVQSKGSIVRDLQFNYIENVYSGNDLTTLANHLFYGHQIVEWAYADEPFKIIWAVREDGVLLAFTYLREQEVYAWSHHITDGKFKNVCVIAEGDEDVVYVVVERYIQGAKHHYVERMASRNLHALPDGSPNLDWFTSLHSLFDSTPVPADLSRAWFLDSALAYPLTYPAATLLPLATTAEPSISAIHVSIGGSGYTVPIVRIDDDTGTGAAAAATVSGGVITAVTVTDAGENYSNPTVTIIDPTGSGAVLAAQLVRDVELRTDVAVTVFVGDTLRANNGYGTVRSLSADGMTIIVNMIQEMSTAWPVDSGSWSCTTPVSTVSGLGHLEGETVGILADGNVMPKQRVTSGLVTLESPASSIVVGLPYSARLQSLYLDIPGEQPTVQGKRKKISAVTVRQQDSRGLQVGHDFDDMLEIKEREYETMGTPILPFTGDRRINMTGNWDVAGQICVAQRDPLPATILGLIPEVNIGDSPQ
jgi:hypothetical protein